MADQLMLEIVTPEKTVFTGEVEEVTIPGVEGEFGVLMGHESLLSAVKFGEMNFTRENKKSYYAVNTGYAEVTAQKVTILVESCEKAEDIDVDRARRAKDKAEQNLSKLTKDDPDFDKIKDALQRAETRIKVSERK